MTHNTDHGLLEDLVTFYKKYCMDSLKQIVTSDTESLYVQFSNLYRHDPDLADDVRNHADGILEHMEEAVEMVDLPTGDKLTDVTVRVTGLNDEHVYAPGEVRKDIAGQYVGIRGTLERVTTTSDQPEAVAFECQRCGTITTIPQESNQDDLQEPHECKGCERQGPFKQLLDHEQSEWNDYAKLRIQSRPDVDNSNDGKLAGYALNDLIDVGGESGLIGRAGEPVVVYGIIRRVQKSGRGENQMLFDHIVEAKAVEFERDDETVDVDEHKDEFLQLAAEPDAVDKFAESIAPNLHATEAWETAMEFAVAYLFGAPRIDIDNGPTFRGDLHFLIVSDFGMGKSDFKTDIEAYSPKCISKSTTALSSGVGLTAAAVKDDFGEGQWTIKPGLLVRANEGHLLLDELDKGPDELTAMNDALEGKQQVDVEKAGKSVTYDSRTALMALGNPEDGRFNPHDSISEQLGISQSLLSRFDGIVTMEDNADEDLDQAIAETFGKSYTEAQQAEYGDREEFDTLERHVPIDVGQAWIKYAREEITPILRYEQFQELEDWYATEVRQLNKTFAEDGEGGDMPVPATVRVLGAAVKMSIAFARVHLREEVNEQDIERAKKLGKRLVKQKWNGERFDAVKDQGSSFDQLKPKIINVIGDDVLFPDEIASELRVSESSVRSRLESMAEQGDVIDRNGKYEVTE